MNQKILNSKERKEIISILKEQFGFLYENEYYILQKDNLIYFFSGNPENIDFENLRISQIGIKIGELKNNKIILSTQGTQIIGPNCNKNILELSKKDARNYLRGEEFKKESDDGIYLLKFENEFIGCCIIKSNFIFNTIDKARIINCKD